MNILLRGVVVGVFAAVVAGCASKGEGTGEGADAYPLVLAGTRDRGDPSVVLLRMDSSSCTGTVISPHHVLTAAHCVRSRDASGMSVTWSRHRSAVTRVHLPPRNDNRRNDIAVIEVADSITTTPVPVNLDPRALDDEMHVRLVGFGLTSTGSADSGLKREGEADVRRTEAYLRTVPGTGGSCYGDSGGPALARLRGRETVVGVVSHGLSRRCEAGSEFVRTDVHRAFLASFVGARGVSPAEPPSVNPVNPTPPPSLPGIDGPIAIRHDEQGCQVVIVPGMNVRICTN